jgi:hypothetical protein
MNYEQPMEIGANKYAFKVRLGDILPARETIPDEFEFTKLVNENQNPYFRFAMKWFYDGLEENELPAAKNGINQKEALRHLHTILGSFEPKHEHKCEAVTYLASLWLVEPKGL